MRFLRFTLFLVCLAVSGAAGAIPFSSLFVFGDSNSDNGRRLALQGTKPAPPYFMGRHSNGLVAVEHVAAGLGLGGAQFVNYAVGGALSGHGNVDAAPVLAATGLLDQLATFQSGHPAADPGALYFIYGGDNDINECKGANNASCTTAQIQAVVANLVTLVQGLSGLGARHFMVIGSYGGGLDKNELRTLLPAAMHDLDSTLAGDILYFNARPVLLGMIAAGNPYGFTHTSSASPCYTGDLTGGGSVCPDPGTYVFWDDRGHLTAPAHAILGRAMLVAVPGPATPALLLLGLAVLGVGARQKARGKRQKAKGKRRKAEGR
jgi:phospholipase/lecithinase/hemolysin